jgi:hypothetical protein
LAAFGVVEYRSEEESDWKWVTEAPWNSLTEATWKRLAESTANRRCLTDGRNFLWVYGNEKGLVSMITRYGENSPECILQAIVDEFHVDIVSEHEPQFWGYETEEEWNAAWSAMGKKDEQDFYNEVVKFVQRKEHDIRPGTLGMTLAEIAKRLIAETPDLLAEDKRPDLIKAVHEKYLQHPVDIGEPPF